MSKNRFQQISYITLVLFFALNFKTVSACMYGPPYRTVCETFAQASSVIIGKILNVEDKTSYQVVEVEVEKTYKGEKKKKIILTQPRSICDWDFSKTVGETKLLYLVQNRKTKTYSAIAEGMGGTPEKESENLYWLNNLPKSLDRTSISGTIELYQNEPFEFMNVIVGTKVRIFNKKTSFEVFTDKNGVYEVWDLPIGRYKIVPEFTNDYKLEFSLSRGLVEFKQISDVKVDTEVFTIEIQKNGCGGSDYILNKSNE